METHPNNDIQRESYLRIYGNLPIVIMEQEHERVTERIQELLIKKAALYEAIEIRRQNAE